MTAKELRSASLQSVKNETDHIEKTMVEASKKGEMKVFVTDMSDAAREYFKGLGFEVKIVLRINDIEEGGKVDKYSICW